MTRGPDPVAAVWWAVGAVWWTLVGALVGFGVVGILTIGLPLLALAAVLGVIGLVVPRLRGPAMCWAASGLAAAPLFIAWLNRHGPGDYCRSGPTWSHCTQQWNPWPFLIAGLLLLATGPVLELLARRVWAAPRPGVGSE